MTAVCEIQIGKRVCRLLDDHVLNIISVHSLVMISIYNLKEKYTSFCTRNQLSTNYQKLQCFPLKIQWPECVHHVLYTRTGRWTMLQVLNYCNILSHPCDWLWKGKINIWSISHKWGGQTSNYYHIEAETIWPTFRRWHFQMHLNEWKCMNFD